MPAPFSGVTGVPKTAVARRISRTCLTFAAMQRVRGLVSLLLTRLEMLRLNDMRPVDTTPKVGQREAAGESSVGHLCVMEAISPVRQDRRRHCRAALGAILYSRSMGCSLSDPDRISPAATACVW